MTRSSENDRFVCKQPDCRRRFPKAEHLVRHERVHSGAKPFSCAVCHRRFARNDSMMRHSKLHNHVHQLAEPVSMPQGQEITIAPSVHTHLLNDGEYTGQLNETLDEPSARATQAHDFPPGEESRRSNNEYYSSVESLVGIDDRAVHDSHQIFDPVSSHDNPITWNLGSDWALSSEDFFNLLRADSSMPPLPIPLLQYSPDTQLSVTQAPTTKAYVSGDKASGSVDASREAVRSMNKVIRDLPTKLVAELESNEGNTSFFDDCLDLFFTHFSSTLPLLHKPTFIVRDCGSTLLLNILALGSLFIGTKDAVSRGEALWSLAHAVVATSWQTLMSQRGPRDDCDGVQLVLTAALGQTYAMLSKHANIRMTSQIFHSLGFYWSRHCRMYDTNYFSPDDLPSPTSEIHERTEVWRTWAAAETRLRAVLVHYILDAQIAHASGNPTCVRHTTNPLPLPVSQAAFSATSADDWIVEMNNINTHGLTFDDFISALFRKDPYISTTPISSLGIQVVLECLQSLVLEATQTATSTIGIVTREQITTALLHLYRWQISRSPDHADLSLRWHAVFLSLTVDIGSISSELLSRCKTSSASQNESYTMLFKPGICSRSMSSGKLEIHEWVQDSIDSRRALLHAFAIRDIAQCLSLKEAHAIHIPSTLFTAATIQAAHMSNEVRSVAVPNKVDWDTVWMSENGEDLMSGQLLRNSSLPPSTLFELPQPNSPQHSLPGAYAAHERGKLETQAFLAREFFPQNARDLMRKMPSELHALRMQLKAMASPWGVSQQMDKVMEVWHESLR